MREDLTIERLLGECNPGFYIDVGANDPFRNSNTHPFYEKGWRGIDIEPMPQYAAMLRQAHPENIVLACAVGAEDKKVILRYPALGDAPNQLATVDESIVEHHNRMGLRASWESLEVQQRTLNDILYVYGINSIDFISIDVEGYEAEVLSGLDLSKYKPKVLCIEATLPSTDIPYWDKWEYKVLPYYKLEHFDGYNRFYVRT